MKNKGIPITVKETRIMLDVIESSKGNYLGHCLRRSCDWKERKRAEKVSNYRWNLGAWEIC